MGRTLTLVSALLAILVAVGIPAARANPHPAGLFGYHETKEQNIALFPQWTSVLERHLRDDVPRGDCSSPHYNTCHLHAWLAFLKSIRNLPPMEQLRRVNDFANKVHYVLDIDNYGVEDYWADVREFLYNGGDCEDYAITKFFSLRWLGYSPDSVRIVVLQDTNLRVPHAVLAVYLNDDVYILDNQTEQVVSDTQIVHYVPVYSINEKNWWLYTPAS